MSNEKRSCPTCGSIIVGAKNICEICGENLDELRSDTSAEKLGPPDIVAKEHEGVEAAGSEGRSSTPEARRCNSCGTDNDILHRYCHACGQALVKRAVKQRSDTARARSKAQLFSTTQWLVICIAAMLFGGVATSVFMPPRHPEMHADHTHETQDQRFTVTLEQLNAARDAATANPTDPAPQLRYANLLHNAKLLDQAIAQYKSYLDMVPDDPDARVDLGICYFEQEKYAEAIQEMERAVSEHPRHILGHFNLGIVNLNAGNREQAREWFTKAHEIDPNSPGGQNALRILQEHF